MEVLQHTKYSHLKMKPYCVTNQINLYFRSEFLSSNIRCMFRFFFLGGGGRQAVSLGGGVTVMEKRGNFGRVGDKRMFKMYKKSWGREGG